MWTTAGLAGSREFFVVKSLASTKDRKSNQTACSVASLRTLTTSKAELPSAVVLMKHCMSHSCLPGHKAIIDRGNGGCKILSSFEPGIRGRGIAVTARIDLPGSTAKLA